jgi:hypothetical protein
LQVPPELLWRELAWLVGKRVEWELPLELMAQQPWAVWGLHLAKHQPAGGWLDERLGRWHPAKTWGPALMAADCCLLRFPPESRTSLERLDLKVNLGLPRRLAD